MTVRSGSTELAHEIQHLGGRRLVVDAGDLAKHREPRAQARLLACFAHIRVKVTGLAQKLHVGPRFRVQIPTNWA